MSKGPHFKIKEQISRDPRGVIYRAQDASSGKKIALRKHLNPGDGDNHMPSGSALAYQVAIGRLRKVHHPSLRSIVSGGCDPETDSPYLATRWTDADPLQAVLKDTYLSVELASALLSQLLEVSELLSQVLSEDGIWIETDSATIAVDIDKSGPRFIFWPSPIKSLEGRSTEQDVNALIDLTEGIMGWKGHPVDERAGGHLLAWLNWLKEDADRHGTTIREMREMLAAAAGVEPPPPIDGLVAECTRKRSLLERWPSLSLPQLRAPKMPLFVFLSILFVIEAGLGWLWLKKINNDVNEELEKINRSMDKSPYLRPSTDPDETGTQPLDFTK